MAWTIEYSRTAKDPLRKLDRGVARRILTTMDERIALLENPRQNGEALKGPPGEFWCYRIGDCRVVCDIQDSRIPVVVLQIGNRREAYR